MTNNDKKASKDYKTRNAKNGNVDTLKALYKETVYSSPVAIAARLVIAGYSTLAVRSLFCDPFRSIILGCKGRAWSTDSVKAVRDFCISVKHQSLVASKKGKVDKLPALSCSSIHPT